MAIKTSIIFGAGFTASLGMPTTWQQEEAYKKLAFYKDSKEDKFLYAEFISEEEMTQLKDYISYFCGQELGLENSSMLLQTHYKKKSSYIQEIQTSMRLEILNSDRLIFIGYSLPDDDIEYRSTFTSLKNNDKSDKKIYLLLRDKSYSDKDWTPASKLNLSGHEKEEEISRYVNIFGKDHVYYNGLGFPNGADAILELLK